MYGNDEKIEDWKLKRQFIIYNLEFIINDKHSLLTELRALLSKINELVGEELRIKKFFITYL